MKHFVLLISGALLCSCNLGSGPPSRLGNISQVSYIATSGPVPQEHQWTERYIVSGTRVRFVRSGPPEAYDLNTGTWEFEIDPQEVQALYGQLEGVDPASVKEVPPEDPLDGGGSTIYEIQYGEGNTLSLWYGDGTRYEGETAVVDPIAAFINRLTLPAEAAPRYSFATPSD